MKKIIVAMAIAFVATTASAAISGSSHDLTTVNGGSTCAYCHMPHNSPSTAPGAPLWARNIDYSPAGGYTSYSSTVAGASANTNPPNAGSRVCLSCHDGTQSMSVVFNADGTGTQLAGTLDAGQMTGPRMLGTDLRNDHPVSVTYSTTAAVFGLTATPDVVFNITQVGVSTVECTSCHNAHNGTGVASSYQGRQFMVARTGDFCGGCHQNK